MRFDDPVDNELYTLLNSLNRYGKHDDQMFLKLCQMVGLEGKHWLSSSEAGKLAELIGYCRSYGLTEKLLIGCRTAYPTVAWPATATRGGWRQLWKRGREFIRHGMSQGRRFLYRWFLRLLAVGGLVCYFLLLGAVLITIAIEVEEKTVERTIPLRLSESEELELYVTYPTHLPLQEVGGAALPLTAWLNSPISLTTPQRYTLTLQLNEALQFYQDGALVITPRLELAVGGGAGANVEQVMIRQGAGDELRDRSVELRAELTSPGRAPQPLSLGALVVQGRGSAALVSGWRFLANPETFVGVGSIFVAAVGFYLSTVFATQQRREEAARAEKQKGTIRTLDRQLASALPETLLALKEIERHAQHEQWEQPAQEELQKLRDRVRHTTLAGQVLRQVGKEVGAAQGSKGILLLQTALDFQVFAPPSDTRLRTLIPFLDSLGTQLTLPSGLHPRDAVQEVLAIWDDYQDDALDLVVLSLNQLAEHKEAEGIIRERFKQDGTTYPLQRDRRLARIVDTPLPPHYQYPKPAPAPAEGVAGMTEWLSSIAKQGIRQVDPFSSGQIRNDELFHETTILDGTQAERLKEVVPQNIQVPTCADGEAVAFYLDYYAKHRFESRGTIFSVMMPFAMTIHPLPHEGGVVGLREITHAVGEAWLEFLKDGNNHSALAELTPRQQQQLAYLLLWITHSPNALFQLLGVSPHASQPGKRALYHTLSSWLDDLQHPPEVSVERLRQWVMLRPVATKATFMLIPLTELKHSEQEAELAALGPLAHLAPWLAAHKVILKIFSPVPIPSLPTIPLRWRDEELRDCLDRRVRVATGLTIFRDLFQFEPPHQEAIDIRERFVKAANGSLATLLQLAHTTVALHIQRVPGGGHLSLAELPDGVEGEANG